MYTCLNVFFAKCVVNCKDAVQHVSITTCSICNVVSTMDLDMVKHHLSSVVNHSLLGHLKWQEIELQLKAENIGFKGNLFLSP